MDNSPQRMALRDYTQKRDELARRIAAATGDDPGEVIERAYEIDRRSGWTLGTLAALRAMLREGQKA